VDAMAAAHQARGDPDAVMAMVVQPGERNAYDQQARDRPAMFRSLLQPSSTA